MGYDKIDNWTLHNCLFLFEKFNGGGYIKKGINSPYLWSYTNHYGTPPNVGKYTSDHGFDPNAISKQAGTAAILKQLLQPQ
jgi:lysozyme family protein